MAKKRMVKITRVDMDGFCGRERHPTENMAGMTGFVVKSYYESYAAGLGSDNDESMVALAQDFDEAYEVVEAYMPALDIVVTLIEHEFENLPYKKMLITRPQGE